MRLFEIDSSASYTVGDMKRLMESLSNTNWSGLLTVSQVTGLDNGNEISESGDKLKVRKTELFDETLAKYSDQADKLNDFLLAKTRNPIEPYGKSDTAFISAGPIGRTGLKLRHAHLSQNISVVYKIHGSNPHILDLYALMTHKDLGTSNTSNIKQQKKVSKKFLNQEPK